MNNEKTVKNVRLGEEIKVKLFENASTGYRWQLATDDNFTLLGRVLAEESISSVPGSGNHFLFVVKATKPGEHVLRFELVRPWEKTAPPVESYEEVVIAFE